VQTQNRLSARVAGGLPIEVTAQRDRRQGQPRFLSVIAVKSDDGSLDSYALNNIIASRLLDPLQRVPGVGQRDSIPAPSMRCASGLNPAKLQGYGLGPSRGLERGARAQNVQFAAGSIGSEPLVAGQGMSATVRARRAFHLAHAVRGCDILRTNTRRHDGAP